MAKVNFEQGESLTKLLEYLNKELGVKFEFDIIDQYTETGRILVLLFVRGGMFGRVNINSSGMVLNEEANEVIMFADGRPGSCKIATIFLCLSVHSPYLPKAKRTVLTLPSRVKR